MDLRRQERETAAGDGSKMSDRRRCPRQPLPVAAAIEDIDFEGKIELNLLQNEI